MADQLVNVFDPDTQQVGSIPAHQLSEALKQGFEPATPEQVHAFESEQKYGSVGQQAITGLEGAASAATFGASTGIEKAAGIRAKDIQGRREENPVSHGVGQVAGLVGSSLLVPGGGAAGALEAAGEAGARALVPAAEEVYGAASALKNAQEAGEGVDAARAGYEAAKASQPFIAKIGSQAADQAIQFGLLQSGDEVSKMFSGAPGYEDPGSATETALTNIGLSSLLGGATGVGFGVVSPLWKATLGQKAENLLNTLRIRANGESAPIPKSYEGFLEGAPAEIRAGLSENPVAKEHFQQLIESGTQPGETLRETVSKFQEDVRDKLKSIFQTEEPITAFDAGEKAKETFLAKAEELNAPIKEKYGALSKTNEAIVIPDEARIKFGEKLVKDGQEFGAVGSPYQKMFENYSQRAMAQDTVAQQDKLMTEIGSEWAAARRAGDFEKARALGDIRSSIREFQDQQIEQAVKLTAGEDPIAKATAKKFVEDRLEARKMYSEFIEKMGDVASVGKLGKVKSFGQFQEALDKIPSAKLADKLFDKKNVEGLNYLRENYPEVLGTLIKQKKSEMLEGAIKGEDFLHNTILNKYQKLPEEVKSLMFSPEERSAIEASTTLLRQSGKRINPSGTARGIDTLWKHMGAGVGGAVSVLTGHNPIVGALLGEGARYVGREVPDAIKLSLLKFLGSTGPVEADAWKTAVDFIDHAYKAQRIITTASKNIFKSGAEVIAREKYPNDNDRKRLEKKLKELGEKPEALVDIGGKTSHYLPDHGAALAQTSVRAVNYLNSLKPNLEKKAPLDAEPVENPIQKSQYNRALDIAEQPLILLNDIKQGTITSTDIIHLSKLYPSLYTQLKQNVMNQLNDALTKEETIPYKTKLGVSLFMGQPLDSTMTPQSLMALNVPQVSQAQPQMRQPRHSSMKDLGKVAKGELTLAQSREANKLG